MGKKNQETETETATTGKVAKREILSHPAVRTFDASNSFIGTTRVNGKADNKYEIVWPIPKTDEEAKERYNCSIKDLILKGVQQISHSPDFATLFDGKDVITPEQHQGLQDLADAYKVGQRKVGGATQKAKAQAATKAEEEVGMTVAEMAEYIKKAKAGK